MFFSKKQFVSSVSLLSLLCSPVLFAGTMGEGVQHTRFLAMLSGGAVWERAGLTQVFYLAPGIERAYVADSGTHALAEGELFLAFQRDFSQKTQGQLGIAIATTGNAKLSGQIWEEANAALTNYVYQYEVKDTRLLVKGRLLRDTKYPGFKLYGHAGLGIGFNDSHSYTSTPTTFEALPTPNFESKTVTSFTYTLGLGFQKVLMKHWQAGFGYEFSDWGRSQLARAPGQTMNEGLKLNHLYTNGILANITYLT